MSFQPDSVSLSKPDICLFILGINYPLIHRPLKTQEPVHKRILYPYKQNKRPLEALIYYYYFTVSISICTHA